jgi:hypothetical protein
MSKMVKEIDSLYALPRFVKTSAALTNSNDSAFWGVGISEITKSKQLRFRPLRDEQSGCYMIQLIRVSLFIYNFIFVKLLQPDMESTEGF